MLNTNEIKNAIRFYEVLKKDLHNLMVKGMDSPLDFEGRTKVYPELVISFEYRINEIYQSKKTYNMMLNASILIESMLKNDVRLWGKTHGIKSVQVIPDHRCETVVMEIGFME